MDEESIASLIESQAAESLNLEYKAAFAWTNSQRTMSWLQAQAIQAILGFTNTEGGGLLLIGVKDDGASNHEFTGITADMQESYKNIEAMQACIDSYGDGPMSYTIRTVSYKTNKVEQTYVAINVNEFASAPVLCDRDFYVEKSGGEKDFILRKHELYARSRKGRYGTIKATGLELQEIINLAHSKNEERLTRLLSSIQGQQTAKTPQPSPSYEALDKDL